MGCLKVLLLKGKKLEEKDTEKKPYEEPTLVRQEKLSDITEGGAATVGSNAVSQAEL